MRIWDFFRKVYIGVKEKEEWEREEDKKGEELLGNVNWKDYKFFRVVRNGIYLVFLGCIGWIVMLERERNF